MFYVASRGHHADIGGISPGSMPPFSRALYEEGACIKSFKLVKDGEIFMIPDILDLFYWKLRYFKDFNIYYKILQVRSFPRERYFRYFVDTGESSRRMRKEWPRRDIRNEKFEGQHFRSQGAGRSQPKRHSFGPRTHRGVFPHCSAGIYAIWYVFNNFNLSNI